MFSNAGNNSGDLPISEEELRRVLSSPEGRQLLRLLRRGGDAPLLQAAASVKSGDFDTAKKILAPMLRQPEAAALLDTLRNG